MVLLTWITVGTLKEDYLQKAFAEYKKRLSAFARVESIELKEEKLYNEENTAEVEAALRREGERILAACPTGAYKIVLAIEGKMLSSEELAEKIREGADGRGKIAVIIGSSYGLSPEVKRAADLSLSMSRLTFPHQLARVLTGEALYRSFAILAGKKYHK